MPGKKSDTTSKSKKVAKNTPTKAQVEEEKQVDPQEQTPEVVEQENETEPQPEPGTDLKIVLVLAKGRGMIGIQSPNCDPVITTLDGELTDILERVPGLISEAKDKWNTAPRYPKADLPKPEPAPASSSPRTTSRSSSRTSSQPKEREGQPSFF